MTRDKLKCQKCNGEMVQGFVPDYYSHGAALVGAWLEGQPKKSFWSRAKVPSYKQGVPIGAFRCRDCGYLEFFARPEFTAK